MSMRMSWPRRLGWVGGIVLLTGAALLPWGRNHAYLRDFYDYGLVMSGVGRIAAGERPYVDFVTPIQTGTFLFNGWAERAGGGTYQAMTLGAAGLIVLSVVGLAAMFARRWPAWVAGMAAGALTVMSASQHTIIWHNCLGALGLVVVAWATAVAPVWRRQSWPWHVLVGLALFVGGINKLNAQLVALACAAAWAVRAGLRQEVAWGRVAATLLGWVLAGVVAPVASELWWTGADFATWWRNVVALPFSSRAGDFSEVLRWQFYFTTHHNYYGGLTIPWLGALGVGASAWCGVVAWRAAAGWSERGWAVMAALFACGAGAGLLATNYEIAWVAMAAWFGLLAALWLGLGLAPRGRGFIAGWVVPAGVVAVAAWHSAWIGQRSQFGYSTAARASYRLGESIAPDYAYLRGTRVPPELATTMAQTLGARQGIPSPFRSRLFYGPGLEWLERVWPAQKVKGLPLWMHRGTSYGAAEEELLCRHLRPGGTYEYMLVSEARDFWDARTEAALRRDFEKQHVGPTWLLYRPQPARPLTDRPILFAGTLGGNADGSRMISRMGRLKLSDGREFLGVAEGNGDLQLEMLAYRMNGEAVVRRRAGAPHGAISLRFGVYAISGGELHERESFVAELPAGEAERVFPVNIQPGGVPMLLTVQVPPELAGRIEAGWRGPQLQHMADGPAEPPLLVPGAQPAVEATDARRQALLPVEAQAIRVFLRGGEADPSGLLLPTGGEVWLRLSGFYAALDFTMQVARPSEAGNPMVRVVFYKNGRMEIVAQQALAGMEPVRFHAWSAESDGWLGILVDANPAQPPVRVRFEALRRP